MTPTRLIIDPEQLGVDRNAVPPRAGGSGPRHTPLPPRHPLRPCGPVGTAGQEHLPTSLLLLLSYGSFAAGKALSRALSRSPLLLALQFWPLSENKQKNAFV